MITFGVSELNTYIDTLFKNDYYLSNIKVKGEIENFTEAYSGHLYFSLKDENSTVKAVMYSYRKEDLTLDLENGMEIIISGQIAVYNKSGNYQIIVDEIELIGKGELYLLYLKLKEKLEKEGLFDDDKKKTITKYPQKIGMVTSIKGAAIHDMIDVIKRRTPLVDIVIYPATVQGDNAAIEIIEGLKYLDSREDIDLLIFGRGGGTYEDLYCFNDEDLVRTIYELNTPCISAIGHEVDYTLSDFAADKRAGTPSIAAEIATKNSVNLDIELENRYFEIEDKIYNILNKLTNEIKIMEVNLKSKGPINKVNERKMSLDSLYYEYSNLINNLIFDEKRKLSEIYEKIFLADPTNKIKTEEYKLINLKANLNKSIKEILTDRKLKLIENKFKLDLENPKILFEKGHSYLTDEYGKKITNIRDINLNQKIIISLIDGKILAEVLKKE